MPYPWEDSPFASNPFSMGGFTPQPPPTQEDADSLLASLGHGALSGLGYIGGLLDKTFGGRAVRGILGGNFREALSPLPLSDTLGVTNPDDITSGRDLLQKYGLQDKGDQSWGGFFGGLGTELLLDPANYLTFGAKALTEAGLSAAKAGTLAPTMAGRIAAGQGGLAGIRSPWFASMLGIGSHEPAAVLGTGARSMQVANALGDAADFMKKTPSFTVPYTGLGVPNPIPRLRQMFDYWHGGRTANPDFQAALEDVNPQRVSQNITAEGRAAAYPGLVGQDEAMRAMQQAAPTVLGSAYPSPTMNADQMEVLLGAARQQAGEGLASPAMPFVPATAPSELQRVQSMMAGARPAGFVPQFDVERDLAAPLRNAMDSTREELNSVGMNVGDRGEDYFYRTLDERIKAAATPQARARLSAIAGLPTNYIQETVANPDITGFARDPMRGGLNPDLLKAAIDTHKEKFIQDIFSRPELSDLADQARQIAQQGPTGIFSAAKWLDQQAGAFSKYMANLDPTKFTKDGKQFFGPNTAGYVLDLIDKTARDVPAHMAAQQVIGKQAGFYERMVRKAGDTQDVIRLDKLPDYLGKNNNILNEAIDRNAITHPSDLKSYGIDRKVADMLKAELDPGRFVVPQATGLLGLSDRLTQLFKTYVTNPFPSWAVRNATDQLSRVGRGGGLDQLGEGLRAAAGDLSDPLRAQYARELWEQGGGFDRMTRGATAVTNPAIGDVTRFAPNPVGNVGQSAGSSILNALSSVPETEAGSLWGNVKGTGSNYMGMMQQVNARADDAARYAQFASLRQAGYSPAAAAEEVVKNFGDFSKTTFERAVASRAIPFYGFARGNLPTIFNQLATNPGVVSSEIRLADEARQDAGFLPPWIGRGTAIPLPGAPEGYNRYLTQIGISLEDPAMQALGSALGFQGQQAAQELGGMLAPQLKYPIEQMSGVQLFSGRKLDDLQPSGIFSALPRRFAQPLTEAFSNTPAARFLSTFDRATDDRKGLLEKATNLLTGARVQDVDLAKAMNTEGAAAIADLLRGSGKLKDFVKPYIPQNEIPTLSPEEQRLYQVLQLLEQRQKAAQFAAKARAGQ